MTARQVNFAQLNVTLSLAYKNRGPGELADVLPWVVSQLNDQPDFVEVKASHATEWLSWPDFVDAPVYEGHPDHAIEVAQVQKIEAWLEMDRKALISALIASESARAYAESSYARVKAIAEARSPVRPGSRSREQAALDLVELMSVARSMVRNALSNVSVQLPETKAQPVLVCRDNFEISVQVGEDRLCEPKVDDAAAYSRVEVVLPRGYSHAFDAWVTATPGIFGQVPAEVVLQFIGFHGGVDHSKTAQYHLNRLLAGAIV